MGRMRNVTGLIGVAAIVVASASCGALVRQGRSPVYLVIDSLQGSLGNPVSSDVLRTNGTRLADIGQATMRAQLKDPTRTNLSGPSSTPTNDVTITRYHVSYRLSDGRNTPGVDVPSDFDGAVTGTVRINSSATLAFELVPANAKSFPPLANLGNLGNTTKLTTIADVTFYGHDQAGNAVSVSGKLQVDFGDFVDSN